MAAARAARPPDTGKDLHPRRRREPVRRTSRIGLPGACSPGRWPCGRRSRGAIGAGLVPRVTATPRPLRFRRLPTADVASRRVPVAVTLLSRLLGLALLRAERAGEGLLIPRCRSVHTFGMRFAIHIVFVDRQLAPVAVRASVPPNRVARAAGGGRGRATVPAVGSGGLAAAAARAGGDGGGLRGRRPDARAVVRLPGGGSPGKLPAPTASDGAARLCHFKQPDLLLLDLNLPDALLDVLREIRACEGVTGHYDPQLPVIADAAAAPMPTDCVGSTAVPTTTW